MRVLFIGDIVGRPGRAIIADLLVPLRKERKIDFVIANCENASGGVGLVSNNAEMLLNAGVDFFTSGNHIFQNREYQSLFDAYPQVIRPANYPPGTPGRGYYIIEPYGLPPLAIINLIGRTFMEAVDCPFRTADDVLQSIPDDVKIRIVDMHAEATSEKIALGHYLDGRVSAVLGTHTHVQTADERILRGGTAYITDVGMTGPYESVIGVNNEAIIKRFLTALPVRFTVSKGPSKMDSVLVDIDNQTGKGISIERISLKRQRKSSDDSWDYDETHDPNNGFEDD